jgi:hypothetical protein
MTSTHVSGLSAAFPFVFAFWTTRLAASASSWNVRPATPVGVTIVGVDSSTSPRKPIVNFFPLSDLSRLVAYAGKSVSPVEFLTTLVDRY